MGRVVVRHVSGSKANKIEQFPLDTFKELPIGRDQSSAIAFDPDQDDLVSRRHALIRIHKRDTLSFTILDLQSSNGTMLNGERLERECELLVEDRIQLGASGPEFVFDVEPRPAGMVARTRVFTAGETPKTRMSETRVQPEAAPASATAPAPAPAPAQKVGVGKDTVERMLDRERKTVGRKWMYLAAGSLAGIALVGVAAWYMNRATVMEVAETFSDATAALPQPVDPVSMSPAMIMEKYGAATVFIEVGWKLFDPGSGLPVFQKMITRTVNGQRVQFPAFVKLQSGRKVPWLVTDDENQSNFPIGGAGRGSGFVVTDNGFILTNRHVAANWMSQLQDFPLPYPSLLFPEGRWEPREIDPALLPRWVPEFGYLFKAKEPTLLHDGQGQPMPLEGRNYRLDVTFPKNRGRNKATLVRTSDNHDVALMKVDVPGNLPKVDLIPDDRSVRTGEPVTILGYPSLSEEIEVTINSKDWFNPAARQEIVPEPSVTHTGISKNISSEKEVNEKERIRFAGESLGRSYYQLATSATGPGNSGGPVFNGDGQVVGIFAAGTNQIGANVTFAVPIEYGRELLTNTEAFR